jgi:hypothetical protein
VLAREAGDVNADVGGKSAADHDLVARGQKVDDFEAIAVLEDERGAAAAGRRVKKGTDIDFGRGGGMYVRHRLLLLPLL